MWGQTLGHHACIRYTQDVGTDSIGHHAHEFLMMWGQTLGHHACIRYTQDVGTDSRAPCMHKVHTRCGDRLYRAPCTRVLYSHVYISVVLAIVRN